jgi:hypothetical protein
MDSDKVGDNGEIIAPEGNELDRIVELQNRD